MGAETKQAARPSGEPPKGGPTIQGAARAMRSRLAQSMVEDARQQGYRVPEEVLAALRAWSETGDRARLDELLVEVGLRATSEPVPPPEMTLRQATTHAIGLLLGQVAGYVVFRKLGAPRWAAWAIAGLRADMAVLKDPERWRRVSRALDARRKAS